MSRQTWLILSGLGCGGVLLLLVLCGGGGYLLFRTVGAAQAAVSAEVNALLSAAHSGNFAATYSTATTSEFRKAVTEDEYRQLGEAIGRLGALKS